MMKSKRTIKSQNPIMLHDMPHNLERALECRGLVLEFDFDELEGYDLRGASVKEGERRSESGGGEEAGERRSGQRWREAARW